jgi:hypothetical protein
MGPASRKFPENPHSANDSAHWGQSFIESQGGFSPPHLHEISEGVRT